MKVSLICPAHNEENNITKTLDSIFNQTKIPNEVIVVEDSSTDDTFKVLRNYQKKNKKLKIIRVKTKNISKNRNIAIKKSKGDILVCVDAGCVLDKNYIEKIVKPFENKKIKFVGAISKLKTKTLFDKCFASFIIKEKISKNYLPKGHAMAFTKKAWKKIGGFPEHLALGAEDTYFGKKMVEAGNKSFIVNDAFVYWETRNNLKTIYNQFKNYGFWDGRAFSFSELPRNSKLNLIISIFFPLAFLHSFYSGVKLSLKFKNSKSFFYGIRIDLVKIYGYFMGSGLSYYGRIIKGCFLF